MTTSAQLLRLATDRLAAAGVASSRVDAELLLAHVLGVERARLPRDVDVSGVAAFDDVVRRRAAREPLQHIVGTAAFRYISIEVGDGVFVPRPETELLVDAVLPALRANPVAVDLCSGSGALALAVADELPDVDAWAVENSSRALAWLRRNTAGTRVRVVDADIRHAGLLPTLAGRVGAVLSNPPYVPAATDVAPEVRADPAEAVFAGPDGLALMPHVIARAAELLHASGIAAVEHDETHQDSVIQLFENDGRWGEISARRDLAGRPRFVVATRR